MVLNREKYMYNNKFIITEIGLKIKLLAFYFILDFQPRICMFYNVFSFC